MTVAIVACPYCGLDHVGMCPRIKKIRYRKDGSTKYVELNPPVVTITEVIPVPPPLGAPEPITGDVILSLPSLPSLPLPFERKERGLSPQESRVLERLTRGCQNKVIARELGVTEATVKLRAGDAVEHTVSEGDGPVNALDGALRKALEPHYPSLKGMQLVDYKVRVINARAGTAARVRVVIESKDETSVWGTVGVSENVIEASWLALVDAFEHKLATDARKSSAHVALARS